MQITQELINRFFKNECSLDEVDILIKYFSANKEALEKYMSKKEWDNNDIDESLNEEQSAILLSTLQKQLFNKQKTRLFAIHDIRFKAIVAAASVVLLVMSGWWFISNNNGATSASTVVKKDVPATETEPGFIWQVVTNEGSNARLVKLEDGSVITLYKNSTVKYPQSFPGNTRPVQLNGDAFFQVAKNKLKPFIVYTGNLSTTALGTSFRITAFDEGRSAINVKLLTGKVVVKSIHAMPDWKKDRFLLPGELLTYNARTAALVVAKFAPEAKAASNVSRLPQNRHVVKELKFNHTALNEVMNKLALLYDVKINFSDGDLQGMNFTGSVNEYDDVKTILKMIAQMNELQVDQTQDGFSLVSPKKQ